MLYDYLFVRRVSILPLWIHYGGHTVQTAHISRFPATGGYSACILSDKQARSNVQHTCPEFWFFQLLPFAKPSLSAPRCASSTCVVFTSRLSTFVASGCFVATKKASWASSLFCKFVHHFHTMLMPPRR